jgi:hypothetical protein
MTSGTAALIDAMVRHAGPVRRLPSLPRRTGTFLAVAGAVLVLVVALRGMRPDLAERLAEPLFLAGLLAALATGVGGALASLALAAPDRPRAWIALPLLTALAWMGLVGLGCLGAWVPVAPGSVTATVMADCLATVALAATPLSLVLLRQVRRAVPLRPILPMIAAALAAAGFTAVVVTAVHPIAASAQILAWNIGIVALLALIHALLARRTTLDIA